MLSSKLEHMKKEHFSMLDDDSRPGVTNVSSANKGHGAVQAATAGFFCSSFTRTCDTD